MSSTARIDIGSMKQVLIIGGGVAGLSAAKTLAEFGAYVHIVERDESLGGRAFEWPCMATDECKNCGACLSAELVDDAEHLENTEIHLKSEIKQIKRKKKTFKADLTGSSGCTLNVDAIIIATGFEPYDPTALTPMKYGTNDAVITTRELNRIIKKEKLPDMFKGKDTPRIAFIQCIGSRNREQGRDYCSQVCCKVTLRQSNKILDQLPNSEIIIFYMDLQIIGKEFRTEFNGIKDRVKLIQGVPGEIVTDSEQDCLTIFQESGSEGKRMAHHFDTVVLSIGMTSPGDSSVLSDMLDIETDQWGFFNCKGFSLGEGIYSAGSARGPVDILGARQQGIIAARTAARDMGLLSDQHSSVSVAIIGNGHQGMAAARKLSEHGFQTRFLDAGNHDMESSENLEYFHDTRLNYVSGGIGRFHMKIEYGSITESIMTDIIIVAMDSDQGHVSVRGPDNETEYVTGLSQFTERMSEQPEDLPERIAFLLDYSGEEWKANTRNSILAASSLAEKGKEVFVVLKKLLVHGLEGQGIYDSARRRGVRFLRVSEQGPIIIHQDGDALKITLKEATIGHMDISFLCDLLVIPEPVLPSSEYPHINKILKADSDREGFLQSANTRHRLVSSPRRGIFFLGNCHDETDDNDFVNEINEIIACLDLINIRQSSGQKVVALIDERLCSRCLTCFRSCPHGAILLRDSFQPDILPDACFGCGQCVSLCPAKAISLEAPGDGLMKENDFTGKSVVFMCERSAGLAEKEARRLNLGSFDNTVFVPVPCAGSVSAEEMLATLLGGAERVIVAGCHQGNCRSGKGGPLVSKQLGEIIRDAGIPDSQLRYESIAANEPFRLKRLVSI